METYADFCIGTPILIILMVFFALAFLGLGVVIKRIIRWARADDLEFDDEDEEDGEEEE